MIRLLGFFIILGGILTIWFLLSKTPLFKMVGGKVEEEAFDLREKLKGEDE